MCAVGAGGVGGGRLGAGRVWRELVEDVRGGSSASVVCARFHLGLATAVADLAVDLAGARGIDTVALSGGCFLNRWLLEGVVGRLSQCGLKVLLHARLPPHDGCLAIGQFAIAAATTRS